MVLTPKLKAFVIEFLNPNPKEWNAPRKSAWDVIHCSDFESAVAGINPADLRALVASMDYKAFLSTRYWYTIRKKVLKRDGSTCQDCKIKKVPGDDLVVLEVHHLTYDNKGNEHLHLEDLITLCSVCHALRGGYIVDAILQEYRAKLAKTDIYRKIV